MNKIFGANLEFVREDDYVEYFIFPKIQNAKVDDETADQETVRTHLEDIRTKCMDLVNELTKERQYIWHKDEFQLRSRTCSKEETMLNDESTSSATKETKDAPLLLPPHLHGVTHYGDNIADEWFIVFLLTKLTERIDNLIVRVIDSDGEFLLIEAADVLPKWANPDTCEQRVYLAEGCMQLVQNSPSNAAKAIDVCTAIEKIWSNLTLYRVSKEIQDCINERTKEFESLENQNIHHQIVRVPIQVAMLLKEQPSFVAAAVRAFCDRDSIDMKACRSMRYFPPEQQRVRTNVCFTKCLYAMLMHNNYIPDRKIGWNLRSSPNSEEYKEDLLGIKLSSGFEILASQAKDVKGDDTTTPAWKAYVKSLHMKGYFRENIEGSAEYQRLLEQAKQYFRDNQTRFRTAPLVGKDILELLRSTEINEDELRDEENNLRPSDSDDWLNISAEQLDEMLAKRYGTKNLYKSNGDINAEEFTKNISEFLEKQSTFEGVQRDSDDDSTDEETRHKRRNLNKSEFKSKVKKSHSMRQATKNPIRVPRAAAANSSDQEESLITQVKSFLDFNIPEDKWDSNSEMSDYEDEDDIEQNMEAMTDADIKAYMDQMDRELARTTIGQSFRVGKAETSNKSATGTKRSPNSAPMAMDDDFDDIEDFEPIDINVNALQNMMDSYKSQIGGPGPVTNLLSALGAGMSAGLLTAADIGKKDDDDDLKESSV